MHICVRACVCARPHGMCTRDCACVAQPSGPGGGLWGGEARHPQAPSRASPPSPAAALTLTGGEQQLGLRPHHVQHDGRALTQQHALDPKLVAGAAEQEFRLQWPPSTCLGPAGSSARSCQGSHGLAWFNKHIPKPGPRWDQAGLRGLSKSTLDKPAGAKDKGSHPLWDSPLLEQRGHTGGPGLACRRPRSPAHHPPPRCPWPGGRAGPHRAPWRAPRLGLHQSCQPPAFTEPQAGVCTAQAQLPSTPGAAGSPGDAQQEEVELVGAGEPGLILREGAQVLNLREAPTRARYSPLTGAALQEGPGLTCCPAHSPRASLEGA